jgi:hypothetical protein
MESGATWEGLGSEASHDAEQKAKCIFPGFTQKWATQTVYAPTPTRYKPSFTPDAAEGGTRVRPILVPVSPWSRRLCVPWNRAGARSKRHLLQTLIPQPSAVASPQLPHLTGHVRVRVRVRHTPVCPCYWCWVLSALVCSTGRHGGTHRLHWVSTRGGAGVLTLLWGGGRGACAGRAA